METKSFTFNLDGLTEEGRFTGYAAAFGNVDLGGDVIVPGAFADSLLLNGGTVPILDHHQPDRQIGWGLWAEEDSHGLFVCGQLDLNVQTARERHSLLKLAFTLGGRCGLSIGFQTLDDAPDRSRPGVRRLLRLSLLEYSLVTFPMNPRAVVTTVKEEEAEIADHLRQLHAHLL